MLDTSNWPQLTVDVLNEISLDPKNVRLELSNAKVEADIIADLFANEKVLDLVKGISSVGYLTHEVPVAIERQGRLVMVEGNRRLAALKAIQNPMLVPEYQARITRFTADLPDRDTLSRIRVMIAPDRDEADQLIAAIHTGNIRRPWPLARQTAFFQAQIEAGRTYEELVERYPTIGVRRFVFRAHILNLFKSVNYDDPALTDFLATKEWSTGLSTLARIFESKDFADITGIELDDNGVLTRTVSDQSFKEMATVILQGMVDKSINTRTLNSVKSPRFLQLMNQLRSIGDALDESGEGDALSDSSATSDEAGSGAGVTDNKEQADNGSTKPSRRTSRIRQNWLDTAHATPHANYPSGLKHHLAELSEMNVQKFPNATFLVIRAVLEQSIKAFAEEKNIDIRGTGNNTNGNVQLSHTLNWLEQYVRDNDARDLVQPITRIRKGRLVSYTSTFDALNANSHNPHFMVDPDDVFSMWDSINSIMRFLMNP